ncbi:GntR family transcriptional regulator [Acetobacteraceae bacterium H6797]|nr:GntR family transcriptional regulator [Acetobacteraceae bacterium H6797]
MAARAASRTATPVLISQTVLARLQADILDGHYAPGSRLRFSELQSAYDAGIGTLREALSHLASVGMVEVDANRGFRVAPVSEEDLQDVSTLLIEFEQRAIVSSVEQGDAAWEEGVVVAFHRLSQIESLPRAERIERFNEWVTLHRDFHHALVAACRSRWLLHMRGLLYDHMERYRLLSQRHRPQGPGRLTEHAAIKDAALARRGEEAAELLRRQLQWTVDNVRHYAPQFIAAKE